MLPGAGGALIVLVAVLVEVVAFFVAVAVSHVVVAVSVYFLHIHYLAVGINVDYVPMLIDETLNSVHVRVLHLRT